MDFQNNIRDSGAKNLFETSDASLGRQVSRGGVWVFSWRIIQRVLGLARIIILARLLSPNDFGLFGIALLALSFFDTFSQTGFRRALIQKKGDTRPYLDTAWTIGIIRGIFIAAILFYAAPSVASFFKAASAEPILKVMGLAIVVQSFSNIAIIYFQKELEFHKYFAYQIMGTIVDLTVAVTAAFLLRNVWALVLGLLAGNTVRCFVSYLMHPYRPSLNCDLGKARELWGFGRWVFGTNIITFLFNQGDDAFLGKVLGVTTLGFYQMAYRIGQLPATEFAKVISGITFPAYSKIQDDLSKLKEGFLKTLSITTFFIIPLTGLIVMLAPEFTRIFLTEKWMSIVSTLRILVIAGMIRALVTTGGALFQGVGAPNIDYRMNLVRLSTMLITIYPLALFFGMNGVALAVALGNLSCVPIWFTETARIVKTSFKDYFKFIFPSLSATVIACAVIMLIKLNVSVNILSFLFMVTITIAIYSFVLYLIGKLFRIDIFQALIYVIKSLRGK